jgi:trans-aconitate methyltransferase
VAVRQDDWEQHWEDYAESAEHNPAQLYRRKIILRLLTPGAKRVLDIGSGQGDLARTLTAERPGAEIVGLEQSRSGVEAAARKVPAAAFIQRDLLDTAGSPGTYASWADEAVCSEVLEHVDDPVTLLRTARTYLQDGCRLVVTVPGGPMSAFDRHIGHRRHFRSNDLRRTLEAAGFDVDSVSRAGFPFFNLYRLLVILRGERLVRDVASTANGSESGAAGAVMAAFRFLFAFNLRSSPFGWQLVAVASARRSVE